MYTEESHEEFPLEIEGSEEIPEHPENEYVEIEFRTGRIGYFDNHHNLPIEPDQWVIVPVERGVDIGRIIHTSVIQPKLLDELRQQKTLSISRIATEADLTKLEHVETNEEEAEARFKEILVRYPFEMKLIRTVYQFDGNKLTFFFTAEGRVDFREFVRELASFFRTRIELHQTTGRDVAKMLGGMGMCGKHYCCSTFLKHFSQITIKMAKDQNLSGNLSKISGPCGRLLCCLNFEENFYSELSRDFPQIGEEVFFNKTKLYVFKNDYYNKKVHLSSEDDSVTETISLDEYLKLARHGRKRHED